jgi:uncharacterized repeat protein (TIGR03833 family)
LGKSDIMPEKCDGKSRGSIHSGLCVDIIQKQDQRSGKKTRGVVSEILTGSSFHPHGIKVRLKDGKVGRVCTIIQEETFSHNQTQD